jgi:hypothetical protein
VSGSAVHNGEAFLRLKKREREGAKSAKKTAKECKPIN